MGKTKKREANKQWWS